MDTSSTGAPAPTASANGSARQRPEWYQKQLAESEAIMAELDRLYAAEAK